MLALWLALGMVYFAAGRYDAAAVPLLIMIPLAPFAVWRLRRQSARVTAGRES